MTRFLLWLHRVVTAALVRRGPFPSQPHRFISPALDDEANDVAAMIPLDPDEPLDPVLVAALRAVPSLRSPVSRRELAAKPDTMPDDSTRYNVWSRGTLVCVTDDGKEAGRAWSTAILRAGIHQFWDREHHASVPQGLRTELVIPLTVPMRHTE